MSKSYKNKRTPSSFHILLPDQQRRDITNGSRQGKHRISKIVQCVTLFVTIPGRFHSKRMSTNTNGTLFPWLS